MPADNFRILYEFERLITASLASLFVQDEIKALAAEDAESEFQHERPRVDVLLTQGSRLGHFVMDADEIRRESGWNATLELVVITLPDFIMHSAYLGAVREIMARIDRMDLSDANVCPVAMQYHEISEIKTAGTSHNYDTATGAYTTNLQFEICFAIRADAWPGGLK